MPDGGVKRPLKRLISIFVIAFCLLATSLGCVDRQDLARDPDGLNLDNSTGTVGLLITPPQNTGIPVQTVSSLDLPSFNGTIRLKPNYLYTGTVTGDDLPVSSWIKLARVNQGDVLGQRLSSPSVFTDDESAEFSLAALAGTYDLFVYPNNETAFPPLILYSGVVLSEDTSTAITFPKNVIEVNGRIVDAEANGLGGLRVWAETSGESNWYRSSREITADGGSAGEFSLKLPAIDGTYTVNFTGFSSESNTAREVDSSLYPEVNAGALIEILDGELLIPRDAWLDLSYETFEPLSCVLNGRLLDDEGEAVSEAQIVAATAIGGGIFERSAVSDTDGRFKLSLLQSVYQVKITPSGDSDAAFTILNDLSCKVEQRDIDFELTERIALTGTLTDSSAQQLAGVEVRATRQSGKDNQASYTKSAFTLPDGSYRLKLDPGTYDVQFIPPAESTFSRAYIGDVALSTQATLDQSLGQGTLFEGNVVDDNDQPVANAFIEVFRMRQESETAEPIGEGSTDENGVFRIVVP